MRFNSSSKKGSAPNLHAYLFKVCGWAVKPAVGVIGKASCRGYRPGPGPGLSPADQLGLTHSGKAEHFLLHSLGCFLASDVLCGSVFTNLKI